MPRIHFNEVVTRDGFQNEPAFVATDAKVALIDELSACGYAKVEVTSFTSAKAIPMLRDAEEVMGRIRRVPGVETTVLVPNLRGAERALESRADEFNLFMSASETHNLANVRMTREQSLAQITEVARLASEGSIPVNVSLSTSFGCPMEGDIAEAEVLAWVKRFADLGVQGVSLCDTTGMAYPDQVRSLCGNAMQAHPTLNITAHFHDTRGMGLVNALAAAETGIRTFDASLGGLGGCPYAPGASGNVAMEDLVHMFECTGYDTGMDLAGLIEAARQLEPLVGHGLASQLPRAGHRLTKHAPPAGLEEIRARAQAKATRAPQL